MALAGISVKIHCTPAALADRLKLRYGEFLDDETPQMEICIDLDGAGEPAIPGVKDIEFNGSITRFLPENYCGFIDEAGGQAKLSLYTNLPVEAAEYFIRIAYALLLFRSGGIMFHAAGIVHKGHACLFYGHSGSGKTTVSRLSPQDLVLNDDLVMLTPALGEENIWTVHATPFWNPTQVHPCKSRASLAGMFHLVQDKQVYLEKMKSGQALAEVIASTPVIPTDPARNHQLAQIILKILASTPNYHLHFLPDDSFWSVIEQAFTI